MSEQEVHPTTWPQNFNFATEVVDRWATKDPSLPAMIWTDGKKQAEEFTYSYFSKRSHQAANLLQSLGARKGDRLMILLPRVPAWWEIATAAIRMGVVLCPCTTLAVASDIAFRAEASGATIFVGSDQSVKNFFQVQKQCPNMRIVIQASGPAVDSKEVVRYADAMMKIDSKKLYGGPATNSSETSLVYFTSGTTGLPKMVSHNHISYPLAHAMTGKHWLGLSPGKLYWNLSEQGWAKAAWAWFGAWNMGAALFVEDLTGAFSASRMLDTLHQYPITTLCAPPTIYRQLVTSEMQREIVSTPPKALAYCVGAGEPLNDEVIKQWQQMTGCEIKDGYGQTETILLCGNFVGEKVKPGSMGRPMPGLPLEIIDADGKISKTDEEGDIAVALTTSSGEKVTCLFDGYLTKDGKVDRKVRVETGDSGGREWYLTGDRAYRDSDGYLHFVGRGDDVIKASGYRIGPFEVESLLKRHPSVQESAVVASPDSIRGEVVKAFIVLTSEFRDHKDKDRLTKELQEFCKKNAAPYKYPRKIQFVDEEFLPKTISGKIRRVELRKMEAEGGKSRAKL